MRKITPIAIGCVLAFFSCKKSDFRTASSPEDNSETSTNMGMASQRRCAAHDVLLRQIAADPERGLRLDALERVIQERSAARGKPGGEPSRELITIPVVVHVVLPDEKAVTDRQINSQIDVLNEDFQKRNSELKKSSVYLAGYPYTTVANCQIAFDLQQVIRKKTSVSSFSSNDAMKFSQYGGSDAVNPTTALNIWVCNLGGGVLGYAQFPGGNAATDGVVLDYQAFGTTAVYDLYEEFDMGRTATHEIGHWLNLRHIWGDTHCGNDYVSDTPLHEGANYGCPSASDKSFCRGKVSYDMWMNYMDYTDDACLYMFTAQQKERMDLTLVNARSSYYTSSAAVTKN